MNLKSEYKTGIILTIPALFFIFTFAFYPIFRNAILSFHDYSPLRALGMKFVGLENYVNVIQSGKVTHSLYVTLLFTVLSVALELVVGLGIATILARHLRRGPSKIGRITNRIARSVFVVPFVVPTVTAAVTWRLMFHSEFGLINGVLQTKVLWFTDYPLFSIIVADAWHMTPFFILIFFAAIISIPKEEYESLEVDGASGWQQFRFLTFPRILPVIGVSLAFRGVDAFTKVFDIVFMTTGGGPRGETMVFPLLIWKRAFSHFHFGEAATLAVIALIISSVIGILLLKFTGEE